jgi:inosose dehydratase
VSTRIAFSKPTRDAAEEERLLGGFRAAGYDGLQLKTGQFTPWVHDADGFRARFPEPGVASALVLFDTLDDGGEERLDDVIDFAVAVGSERVVFCQNRDREGIGPEQVAELARTLSRFGRRAREHGVALSLHHHFGQPVMTPDDVRVFFDAVEDGAVGLTVDTAHLAKSGVDDLPGFIREFAPVIDNIHLKDYADGEWRLLGAGELDLDGILSALRDVGYAEWICVDEESAATLDDGLRLSREWISAHT